MNQWNSQEDKTMIEDIEIIEVTDLHANTIEILDHTIRECSNKEVTHLLQINLQWLDPIKMRNFINLHGLIFEF